MPGRRMFVSRPFQDLLAKRVETIGDAVGLHIDQRVAFHARGAGFNQRIVVLVEIWKFAFLQANAVQYIDQGAMVFSTSATNVLNAGRARNARGLQPAGVDGHDGVYQAM